MLWTPLCLWHIYRGGGYLTPYNSHTNKGKRLQFHWQTPEYIITLSLKFVFFIFISFCFNGQCHNSDRFQVGGFWPLMPPYQYKINMNFLLFCIPSTIITIHCKNQLSIWFCFWDIMQCHVLWRTCHVLWQPLLGGMG